MMRKETIYFCEYCGDEHSTEASCLEHESKCYKSPVLKVITVYEYSLRFDIYRGEYDQFVDCLALPARYDKEQDEYMLISDSVIPSYITMYRPGVYATCGGYYTAKMYGSTVFVTSEAYTSKTCTRCGHEHTRLGGAEVFKCPNCGLIISRDINGARNIMLRAMPDPADVILHRKY